MTRRDFVGALASAPLLAQTATPPAASTTAPAAAPKAAGTFTSSITEVIVPVTVTDDKGRFVTDLEQKDFHIFEGKTEQPISYFTRERNQPVVIGFLLDLSNASRLHWKNYSEAAKELVLQLLPGEPKYSGYLISFSNEAEVQINTTTVADKITERIDKLKPTGGSALFDAVYKACTSRTLVKGEPIEPRRVIVIIGDGHDNASKKTLDEVLEIAQRNLVTVYGVSTTGFGFVSEGDAILRRFAEETGGRVFYPLQGLYSDVSGYLSTPSDEGNYALKVGTGGYASELANGMYKAIAGVAGEVTTQYIIRYRPPATESAKAFHNIKVAVDLPNVTIRARKGYYANNP